MSSERGTSVLAALVLAAALGVIAMAIEVAVPSRGAQTASAGAIVSPMTVACITSFGSAACRQ